MNFEFATAQRIIFSRGATKRLPDLARELGKHVLLVTGRDTSRSAALIVSLEKSGLTTSTLSIQGESTLNQIRSGVEAARRGADLVIAHGGGSVMDAAKAIAILVTNSGKPLDYLEIIGKGQTLANKPLPVIAIPTTAGTGAEVTRNAVLGSPEHGIKASLRSPMMLPSIALVDPDWTLNLPPGITASTGLDALTQLIEPYVSCRANPMTDLYCLEGLDHVRSALLAAYQDGSNAAARESMAWASLLGGLALANAGLGVVHGFASPLGGLLNAPHGALCAAVLPYSVAVNIKALRQRAINDMALTRYREVARRLTQRRDAEPDDAVVWLGELCKKLHVARLRDYGLQQSAIAEVVEKAAKASSMKGNPIQLTTVDLTEILERAL